MQRNWYSALPFELQQKLAEKMTLKNAARMSSVSRTASKSVATRLRPAQVGLSMADVTRQVPETIPLTRATNLSDASTVKAFFGKAARQLTFFRLNALAEKWWANVPGSSVVIGWISSRATFNKGSKRLAPEKYRNFVTVVRPNRTAAEQTKLITNRDLNKYHTLLHRDISGDNNVLASTPLLFFMRELRILVQKRDPHVYHLNKMSEPHTREQYDANHGNVFTHWEKNPALYASYTKRDVSLSGPRYSSFFVCFPKKSP